jgi:mRNA interferase HigB
MQVIARRTLKQFGERHPQAEGPCRAWFAAVSRGALERAGRCQAPVRHDRRFVGDNRLIFDLGGNNYRLIAHVSYPFSRVLIKFIGTHADYDRIDPETVTWRRRPRRR